MTALSGRRVRLLALAMTLALLYTGLFLRHDGHDIIAASVETSSWGDATDLLSPVQAAAPVLSSTPSLSVTHVFSAATAYELALEQCAIGPRVTGTQQAWATGDVIVSHLKAAGWTVEEQTFSYRDTQARNIIGRKGQGPAVLLGAHYDTRPFADNNPPGEQNQPIIGADDGASGVAVLLELARALDVERTGREVRLAFFDAEDRGGLDGWPFAVGAEYMAAHLGDKPEAMILLDMVGDKEQDFYWEGNSDKGLMAQLWGVAAGLGYGAQFIPNYKWTMDDDHIPFIKAGIPAVDIIDFDYPYWHTTQDTCDKLSVESLGRVGHVVQTWLEHADPANR